MADDTQVVSTSLGFADPSIAQRARDAFKKISSQTVESLGSNPNVGRVMSVDIAKLTATVWFPGDDSPVQVGIFPGSIPKDLGDFRGTSTYETSAVGTGGLVYVEQFRSKPYITRILSGGEYTLNQNVAGLTHQTFNANPQGTISGAPINGIYERHVNVRIPARSDFTVGKAVLVGPWAGNNDGSMIDGIVEVVLSFLVGGNVKNQVAKYQFSVSDRMVIDLEGDEGNKTFWMRALPETTLRTDPHAELALDVGMVKTGIRAPIEMWLRLVPLDGNADQSEYTLSVKTYGSAFNVGDPKTGRFVTITQSVAEPVQGWLGFHNAGLGWTERDEYAAYPLGTYWQDDEWSSGSWRSGPLRAANDLSKTWSTTGQWSWTTSNRLFWDGNIVFKGIGPNWNGLHNGSINVPMPDVAIPVFPSNSASFATQLRDIDAGGIDLRPGETLYYGLCPGSGTGGQGSWHSLRNLFFIVDSKTYTAAQRSFSLPEWAIPIATRAHTANAERREIIICNHAVDQMLDDRTRYTESGYVDPLNGIVGGTEWPLMYSGAFRFRKKTCYRVFFKCGMSSATVPQVVNYRLRENDVGGRDFGEFFRIPMVTASLVHSAQGETYIINDTNADITTNLALTGQASGANTTTWNRFANGNNPATISIQEVAESVGRTTSAFKLT